MKIGKHEKAENWKTRKSIKDWNCKNAKIMKIGKHEKKKLENTKIQMWTRSGRVCGCDLRPRCGPDTDLMRIVFPLNSDSNVDPMWTDVDSMWTLLPL